MSIFDKYINENTITSETDLKRLFWWIAKKIHPDVTSLDCNNDKFIQLKHDYDQACNKIIDHAVGQCENIGRKDCINLFIDVMASNFPIDKNINNKIYSQRIERLNKWLNNINPNSRDLFKKFEREMYQLKGSTVISNHLFNVVKLYLYKYCDYTYLPNKNNKNYLTKEYELMYEICSSRHMYASIQFVNWLVEDIIDPDRVKKSVPNN